MLIRALLIAISLAATPLPAFAVKPQVAPSATAEMTTEELMKATALDQIFTTFAETIAGSPESNGIPVPPDFLASWKQTAFEVFEPSEMHKALAQALGQQLSKDDLAELAVFFRSDFGRRVTALEAAVATLPVEGQIAARDEGIALLEDLAEEDTRTRQFNEIMDLVSADVSRAMLGQAMRAMMVSMALSGTTGDIEVPWDEIDAQVAQMMPGLDTEVTATQRAMMAYAYQTLSDDELEAYIAFLRTAAPKRFYSVLGYAVGRIMEETMSRFGLELGRSLNRVNV